MDRQIGVEERGTPTRERAVYRTSDPQGRLFSSENLYLKMVGSESFYGMLAIHGHRLFPDDQFASMYCEDNGRPCTSPSLLAKALLLQMFDGCSDQEAAQRAQFDIRWKVALCVELEEKPFGRSTLQEFRARVHLNEKVESIFLASVEETKRLGRLKKRKLTVALDTSPVLGRGAVKDTYNLVADGIRNVTRAVAEALKVAPKDWATENHLSRYWSGTSLKGDAGIDWSNEAERRVFLNGLVTDVDLVLLKAGHVQKELPTGTAAARRIEEAMQLLRRLVEQDVDRSGTTPAIKDGVAPDRTISVHDPEMRHGRKSASHRFDGHKVSIAVDTDSDVILGVDVLPGNAPDSQGALKLVEQSEQNAAIPVEKAIGDCAYGDGATRQQFDDANRVLVAKVPSPPSDQPCHKANFVIDLEAGSVTCPAGHTTRDFKYMSPKVGAAPEGGVEPVQRFNFSAELCANCRFKNQCHSSKSGGGRTVTLHPQERLLQAARRYQGTEAYRDDLRARQDVEHRLARLMQLGLRHARYMGRGKTRLQALLTATVANLTRAWTTLATALASEAAPVLA